MIDHFNALWDEARPAFGEARTWERARRLALSALACLGNRTISAMLCAAGAQFRDWSADYRLFEHGRFDPAKLFAPARRRTVAALEPGQEIVAHMDDTRCRHWGKRIDGASWQRDPLGPRFRTQFLWGNRFLQISLSLPEGPGACAARAIPVDFAHCPSARKPRPKDAPEIWREWKALRKSQRLPLIGAARLARLREALDGDPQSKGRRLSVSVDGGFTNQALFRAVPENTTLIGRIRKDARLFALAPAEQMGAGRRKVYGKALATPEQMRKDDTMAWQTVRAWAAGKCHEFRVKTIAPLRWRGAGAQDLRLVIIAPLGYRLSKHSPLLYRNPAYLICTDPFLALEKILQHFIWRGGIEVNFRDEKTTLGMGEAQVRKPQAVALVPAFIAAIYGYLQLACQETYGRQGRCPLPRPKWQASKPEQRISTNQMIKLLRGEIWGRSLGVSDLTHFLTPSNTNMTRQKFKPDLKSAVIYATG